MKNHVGPYLNQIFVNVLLLQEIYIYAAIDTTSTPYSQTYVTTNLISSQSKKWILSANNISSSVSVTTNSTSTTVRTNKVHSTNFQSNNTGSVVVPINSSSTGIKACYTSSCATVGKTKIYSQLSTSVFQSSYSTSRRTSSTSKNFLSSNLLGHKVTSTTNHPYVSFTSKSTSAVGSISTVSAQLKKTKSLTSSTQPLTSNNGDNTPKTSSHGVLSSFSDFQSSKSPSKNIITKTKISSTISHSSRSKLSSKSTVTISLFSKQSLLTIRRSHFTSSVFSSLTEISPTSTIGMGLNASVKSSHMTLTTSQPSKYRISTSKKIDLASSIRSVNISLSRPAFSRLHFKSISITLISNRSVSLTSRDSQLIVSPATIQTFLLTSIRMSSETISGFESSSNYTSAFTRSLPSSNIPSSRYSSSHYTLLSTMSLPSSKFVSSTHNGSPSTLLLSTANLPSSENVSSTNNRRSPVSFSTTNPYISNFASSKRNRSPSVSLFSTTNLKTSNFASSTINRSPSVSLFSTINPKTSNFVSSTRNRSPSVSLLLTRMSSATKVNHSTLILSTNSYKTDLTRMIFSSTSSKKHVILTSYLTPSEPPTTTTHAESHVYSTSSVAHVKPSDFYSSTSTFPINTQSTSALESLSGSTNTKSKTKVIILTPTVTKPTVSTIIVLPSPIPVPPDYRLGLTIRVPDLKKNVNTTKFWYDLKSNLERVYQDGKLKGRKRRSIGSDVELFLTLVEREVGMKENVKVQFYLKDAGRILLANQISVIYDRVPTEDMDKRIGYVVIRRPAPIQVIPARKIDSGLQTWIIVVAVLVPVVFVLIMLNIFFYCQHRAKQKMKLAPQPGVENNNAFYGAWSNSFHQKSTDAVKSSALTERQNIIRPIPAGSSSQRKETNINKPQQDHNKNTPNKAKYLDVRFSPENPYRKKLSSQVFFDKNSIEMTRLDNNLYDQETSIAGELEDITKGNNEFQVNPLHSTTSVRLHKDVTSPLSPTRLSSQYSFTSSPSHASLSLPQSKHGTRLSQSINEDHVVNGTFSPRSPEFNQLETSLNDSSDHKVLLNKISNLELTVDNLKASRTSQNDVSPVKMHGGRRFENEEKLELLKKIDIEKIRNKERIRKREQNRKLRRNDATPIEAFQACSESIVTEDTLSTEDSDSNKKKRKRKNRANRISPSSTSSLCGLSSEEEKEEKESRLKDRKESPHKNTNENENIHSYASPFGMSSFPSRLPPLHYHSPYTAQFYPSTSIQRPNLFLPYDAIMKQPSIFQSPYYTSPGGFPSYGLPNTQPVVTELPKPTNENTDLSFSSSPITLPHGRCVPRENTRSLTESELQLLEKAQEKARLRVTKVLEHVQQDKKEEET
ncbi:uncharacterized protein LOC130612591 [Hydractinia symbiolongicarpus]|uniref:uncharacterized protein LOC130612591 n=1 Tax=Hydractinia symbiolongicarpus TaxID=13093 RepID=UPI002551A28E|nr:uncharacterized protein LOC130612591 [Hydractinia symbiolongicarpus]